ncbi:MAG: 2-aminoethylphosphonate--pyruvate transaminase, partial [Candidatus Ornithomonoglobus sp.]
TAAEAESVITEKGITHLAMVHCETTTGILNDIKSIGEMCRKHGVTFIVDAMSSFGGIDIPVEEYDIDFIISSANKCIQGVPGFSFIIARKDKLISSKGTARSLSLDLYDQWETMAKDGKWRFTSPTHVVLAFAKALEELEAEGGIAARNARYTQNNHALIEKMNAMGFKAYIKPELQSPVITTFECPEDIGFSFEDMYGFIKERGYAIYPGKLDGMNTFRIGNIGEIYMEDIEKLCGIIQEYVRLCLS